MPVLIATLLAAGAAAPQASPVTVEIVASGHVESPADRFRVTGSVLACAATQSEADALLSQKVAAIDATKGAIGVTKAHAQERPSLAGMMGAMSSLRGPRDCNTVDMKDLMADAGKTKEANVERVSASTPLAFDAPTRAAATRAIAALKTADAKPADTALPVLLDDTAARRSAKQRALAKAKLEADAYAAPLGLGTAMLTGISEKQDWASVDFLGQMFRTIGLVAASQSDTVSTDVTLTVAFRLN